LSQLARLALCLLLSLIEQFPPSLDARDDLFAPQRSLFAVFVALQRTLFAPRLCLRIKPIKARYHPSLCIIN
jgi:hypothetical protein